MTPLVIKQGTGAELSKRTYTNAMITAACPVCAVEVGFDGSSRYFSYPVTGGDEELYLYCEPCDHEFTKTVRIDLVITEVNR